MAVVGLQMTLSNPSDHAKTLEFDSNGDDGTPDLHRYWVEENFDVTEADVSEMSQKVNAGEAFETSCKNSVLEFFFF
jgi:hypothetical protein